MFEPPGAGLEGVRKLPGSYSGLRLIPGQALDDELARGLMARLAEELLQHPPYDFRWLKNMNHDQKVWGQ